MNERHDGPRSTSSEALVRVHRRAAASRGASCWSASRPSGATAALAPIIAACTSGGASPAPASAAAPPARQRVAAARRRPRRPGGADAGPQPGGRALRLQLDDYIGEKTIADFEKKYGIKVTYDFFPDADDAYAKLRATARAVATTSRYPDLGRHPGVRRRRASSSELDKSLIPNVATSGRSGPTRATTRATSTRCRTCGGRPGTPGTGQDQGAPTSSKAPLGPALRQSTSGDARRQPRGLRGRRDSSSALGRTRTTPAELDQMLALLEQQKPLVRMYTHDDIGDVTQRAASGSPTPGPATRTQMTRRQPRLEVRHPRGGRGPRLGHDGHPLGRQHPIAAHLWIDYNLDAQVSAANTNFIGYMGPNAAAKQFIDPASWATRAEPGPGVLDKLQRAARSRPRRSATSTRALARRSGR